MLKLLDYIYIYNWSPGVGYIFYIYFLNTFTAKVNHGRFKYLRFNLPESTLVDLKFTLLFCLE
jgi:hypothetical protein